MQTFLPYANFAQSAAVLDYRRLGKQRVEALQLLKTIRKLRDKEEVRGWKNHPCCKMWMKHSNALVRYGLYICREWIERGYKDTCYDKINAYYDEEEILTMPSFFGDEEFHRSHKSNLIRKDPEYYRKYWPDVPDNLEYIWPTE
jgi:hypothetical protein